MLLGSHWKEDHEWDTVLPLWLKDTYTEAGSDTLRMWLETPLSNMDEIMKHRKHIEWWVNHPDVLQQTRHKIHIIAKHEPDDLYHEHHEHHEHPENETFSYQNIWFQHSLLEPLNGLWYIHVPWTLSQMYIQPLMQFLLPLITLLVPFFLMGRMGIQMDWKQTFGKIYYMIKLTWALRSLFWNGAWNYKTILMMVQIIISVVLYFYGIWVCLCNAWSYHRLYGTILVNTSKWIQWTDRINSIKEFITQHDFEYIRTSRDPENINIVLQHPLYQYANAQPAIWTFWFPHTWFEPAIITSLYYKWMKQKKEWFIWKTWIGWLDAITTIAQWLYLYQNILSIPVWMHDNDNHAWGALHMWHPIAKNGTTWITDQWIWKKPSQHLFITGGNAYGKTTFLKTIGWILWMAHGWGITCSAQCDLPVFHSLQSFVRVPDVICEKSFFQAEVSRMKNILNTVKQNNKNIWIWIDEMFSSTNPEDGMGCIYAFLKKISEYKHVWSGYTSHFTDLQILEKNTNKKIVSIGFNEPWKWSWGVSFVKTAYIELKKQLEKEEPEIIQYATEWHSARLKL